MHSYTLSIMSLVLRNFVIEVVAYQPPPSWLQATPPFQASILGNSSFGHVEFRIFVLTFLSMPDYRKQQQIDEVPRTFLLSQLN